MCPLINYLLFNMHIYYVCYIPSITTLLSLFRNGASRNLALMWVYNIGDWWKALSHGFKRRKERLNGSCCQGPTVHSFFSWKNNFPNNTFILALCITLHVTTYDLWRSSHQCSPNYYEYNDTTFHGLCCYVVMPLSYTLLYAFL